MDTQELLQIKVKDVMTTEVVAVLEKDLMTKVDNIMKVHRFNHIPVVDNQNKLLGILTKNDILLMKDWGTNLNLRTAKNSNDQIFSSNTAKDKMNSNMITVSPEDTLEKCALILRKNIFHAIPVVKRDKLVGIITTYDLLNIAYATNELVLK